jgi:SAM-dependent methyltransferase
MCSRSASEPPRTGPWPADDAHGVVESAHATSLRQRWFAAYVGRTYLTVVERALAGIGEAATILKVDLWNEHLGGERDVLGRLDGHSGARRVGIDLSLSVCAEAKLRTPDLLVVQADIRALPFRAGSVDAVLDVSVLDHVDATAIAEVVGGYRRVLRDGGTLALIFWQRSAAVRLRLWLKHLLGRREASDQHYFERAAVRSYVTRGFTISRELALGLLLVLPMGLVGALLAGVPEGSVQRRLSRLGAWEAGGTMRGLLQHASGLYGIVARAR